MRLLLPLVVASILGLALARPALAQEGPPAAPSDLMADAVGGVPGIYLFWQDNSDNEEAFVVERSPTGESGPWTVVSQTPNECLAGGARPCAYVDRDLPPSTTYWYRVAAVNKAGRSLYSNIASASTGAEPTPAPGEIRGTVYHDRNANGTRDAGEEGLSGRQLTLYQASRSVQTAVSSDDGGYLFNNLDPGQYQISADLAQHFLGCQTFAFSYNPLERGACLDVPLPWDATTSTGGDVSPGTRRDFPAVPADAAVVTGDAILELDHAPAGTSIVAIVDGRECGTTAVRGGSFYDYAFAVLGAVERPGCAQPGDIVHFTVGGVPADQVLAYQPHYSALPPFGYLHLVAMQRHAWYRFQTSGENLPADGTLVQAVIDGVVCGEARIEALLGAPIAGFSKLIVPSAELQAGCGAPGAKVTFLFDGVPTGEPIEWRTGLQYINPLAGPVILPSTGSGGSSGPPSDGANWPGALATLAFLLLSGGSMMRRRG